jgi:pimeloyl-ACP methyl ester carboxylesterase
MPDVVVLLPGITGSALRKDGRDVWAFSGGAFVQALRSLGGSLRELELRDDPPDADDLGDGVTADRLIQDVHMVPGLWSIDGYTKVKRFIHERFDVEAGRNYFELPYDWRRDNRVAARRLARESAGWLREWRDRSGNRDAKLILVGHSMGGLVSRYFLECLEGWRDTRMLLTFGTPYRGSLNALGFLANGFRKGWGPLSLDLSALLRSFTSVYQLLPIYPCCDPGTGRLARVSETPIPHVDPEKAAAALAFHTEIRTAVERHLQDPEYQRGRYEIRTVIGTVQPTMQSARVAGDGVDLERAYEREDMGGDGTVPRVSSTPIELGEEAGAMYSNERHASLQNADPVLVQLQGLLSDTRRALGRFRAVSGVGLSLDHPEVLLPDEPLTISVRPEEPLADPLRLEVQEAESQAAVTQSPLRKRPDGEYWAELAAPQPGAYRLRVEGGRAAEPVTALVAVLPPA